jgi:hypothetical protein
LGKRKEKLIKSCMNERRNGRVSDKLGEMVREKRVIYQNTGTEEDLEASRGINEGL